MKTLVEEFVDNPTDMRIFQQERAIYEVTELIEAAMDDAGISRAELAKRLGKSKAWVTQLLDGMANKTIRTVADALAVLGRELRVSSPEINISGQLPPDAIILRMGEFDSAHQVEPRSLDSRSSGTTIEMRAYN